MIETGHLVTGYSFWIATSIFILAYALIISDKIHKTIVAIVGAGLMIVAKIVTQNEAFHSIELGVDWNVIFLLLSMMIIINVMRPSGIFEYIAIKCAKIAKGRPYAILVMFCTLTAIGSALLDNVTAVLLIAPVTLLVCRILNLDVIPYLILEALASNIGGMATLVGNPPNIMIASKASLNFMDFLINLTPIVVILMVVFFIIFKFVLGKNLVVDGELRKRLMSLDEKEAIKDPVLMKKSIVVFCITIAGFIFHGALGFEPATIAFFGAGIILIVSRVKDPHHILSEVEWASLLFFIGLFIIIGGVINVGLITWMSQKIIAMTHGDMFTTSMVIMWFSAFASALIDNIPFVATMNPLVVDMAKQLWPHLSGIELLRNPDLMPVWWSLALGACLGGNGTIIGASANVIIVGIAEKAGKPISFIRFMLWGMPTMIVSVIISTLYIWLRYYLF
jgi:Na+/H+ antiporter NhaD/arsenite permease-like protein